MMNPQFWQGKKVFLTGHTGFKGSWLSLWLQILGAEVVGYSLSPLTSPNLFEIANVAEGMSSVVGDILNLEYLTKVMSECQPEIVIHMAAQALVRKSYQSPVETYNTNVMGTVHLLEAVRQVNSVRAVIIVTSDKCYENREWVWGYREEEPMGGYDPYSSSKGCAELVTTAYRNSFFHPDKYSQHQVVIATGRAGNVIGGGDWAEDRLVPDILTSFVAGNPVTIRNPQATRPWQHVLEPLSGYLTLAEGLVTQGVPLVGGWNFGPNESDIQPVAWVVEKLIELWPQGASWQLDGLAQPHEANSLKLDCSKAKAQLKWAPKLDLEMALTWVVDWAKAWQADEDMQAITKQQIKQYMQGVN
jgi:CDP-glucose 4,6-dehydratase